MGVMFDTSHALCCDEVSSDYVHRRGQRLIHVQVAGTDRMPPGHGVVDWLGGMQALKYSNYQGHVTVEIGFHTCAADPDWHAREAPMSLNGGSKRS
ncbi:sugar phosphate isomerase/epimerase family protein [Deinococcus koreensis]|uniref:sugar phosphate isomerase/epimerase family protein n=1 Tax=Deinococcus koreensis TaxID=2054903 RepID=UPI0010573CE9|nr:TIM barrel protein [Deinococcus koreensis]